jgi:hypothetical protein
MGELNRRKRLGGTLCDMLIIILLGPLVAFTASDIRLICSLFHSGHSGKGKREKMKLGFLNAASILMLGSVNAAPLASFSFADISSCSPTIKMELEGALQNSGGFSISGVPDYDGGAVPRLSDEIDEHIEKKSSRSRSSYAASTMQEEDTLSVLPEEVQGLRSATMNAMDVLGQCMSIGEVRPDEGEVVEHFHYYTGGEEEEAVMPYHTDAGYMIAMTSGGEGDSYTLLIGDEGDEKELGTVGELVVMVGEQVRGGGGGRGG